MRQPCGFRFNFMISTFSSAWAELTSRAGIVYSFSVLGCLALLSLLRRHAGLFALAAFPGTFFHELSHFAIGMLFRGHPAGLRILPKRTGGRISLGSVECTNIRWYNGMFIGLAPLLLLPIAFGLVLWRLSLAPGLHAAEGLWAYFIACLAQASVPSLQDLRVAAISKWMLAFLTIAACLIRIWWS